MMNECCKSPFACMIARPDGESPWAWYVVCRVCGLILHRQKKED